MKPYRLIKNEKILIKKEKFIPKLKKAKPPLAFFINVRPPRRIKFKNSSSDFDQDP